MLVFKYFSRAIFACLILVLSGACLPQNEHVKTVPSFGALNNCVTVISDDSAITVNWWDTGEGGTAPCIESVCEFRTVNGEMKTETRPLLSIVHPECDYGHHEVSRIVSYDTEYGNRIYFFFLRAKQGSNEYAHDLITLAIEGDSLVPVNCMKDSGNRFSHITIE